MRLRGRQAGGARGGVGERDISGNDRKSRRGPGKAKWIEADPVPAENPESLIEGAEKLTGIFGYWPSFHDAEVVDFSLWRGDVNPEKDRWVGPVLTVKIHLWEMSEKPHEDGVLQNLKNTLAVLRFHGVNHITMAGFNHQNPIFGLSFAVQQRGMLADGSPVTPYIVVEFEEAPQFATTFKCFRAEVVSAAPCTGEGLPVEGR